MAQPSSGGVIDLVKTSIAPRVFKTGPPNYYTQTSFSKKLDVSANFAINDSGISASTAEKVPTSSGLIIWQPNRGAGSLYRYGLVPQNTTVMNGARGLLLHYGLGGIAYNSSVAVPYNSAIANDTIKIAPDLSLSFSAVRVYSGDLRVICDTVPIGNTALNGYFSCGSFSDTRDVSQVTEGGGAPNNAFAPADLVQNSVTSKDGLKEVSAMKGIVSLVGSDIQPFYSPPNTDETDVLNGGFRTYDLTSTAQGMVAPSALGAGGVWNFAHTWVSPWDIQYTGVTSPPCYNLNPGPINLNGVLDFKVNFGWIGNSGSPDTEGVYKKVTCEFRHVFVTCTSYSSSTPWACNYSTVIEKYDTTVGPSETSNPANNSYSRLTCDSTPRQYQYSFIVQSPTKTGGMYLGTQVVISVQNVSAAIPSGVVFGQSPTYTLSVRARSIYTLGELGPTRVIRWDGMSDGQQIKVDGCINAQCIPEGAIAPFVQGAAMYSDTAHNLNSMTFLAELYNGDSPFRRNWTGDAYDDFMRTIFPMLSMSQMASWQQPKLSGIAMAGGFWNDLTKGLTDTLAFVPKTALHVVNDVVSSPDGQQALSNMAQVGPGAYGMFGSRGMFGAKGGHGSKHHKKGSAKKRGRPRAAGCMPQSASKKKKSSTKKRGRPRAAGSASGRRSTNSKGRSRSGSSHAGSRSRASSGRYSSAGSHRGSSKSSQRSSSSKRSGRRMDMSVFRRR